MSLDTSKKDTSHEMETLFFKLLLQKSGEERLLMGFSMFDFSRQLVEASLLNHQPSLTQKDLRSAILQSYYGAEINPALKTKFN